MQNLPLIACVDDDPFVCEALEGLLQSIGYAAVTFPSAEDFLAFIGLKQVLCLITDMRLGGISGLQLLNELTRAGLAIPTIVLTAFDDDVLRQQSYAAGAIGVFSKPAHELDLLALIDKATEASRQAPPREGSS